MTLKVVVSAKLIVQMYYDYQNQIFDYDETPIYAMIP